MENNKKHENSKTLQIEKYNTNEIFYNTFGN